MPVSLRSVLLSSLPITGLTSLPTLRPPALPASAKFVATLVGAARRHLAGGQLVLLLGLLLLRPGSAPGEAGRAPTAPHSAREPACRWD